LLTNILIFIFVVGAIVSVLAFYDLFSNLIKATKKWDEKRNNENEIKLKNSNNKNINE